MVFHLKKRENRVLMQLSAKEVADCFNLLIKGPHQIKIKTELWPQNSENVRTIYNVMGLISFP